MNSLHLLASTVDKALSIGKDSNLSVEENYLIDALDAEIVTRADPEEIRNNAISSFEEDEDAEDADYEAEQQLENSSNDLMWKILCVVFFIPNMLIYKPISYIIAIVLYPFKLTVGLVFKADSTVAISLEEEENNISESLESLQGVSSGVDLLGTPRANSISTISEEDDDDLEFEIPSESAILADKLKSPTSQQLSLDADGQAQRQQAQLQPLQQQKKKLKKRKQRYVFPRLLINNSFNLHNPPASIKKKTLILDLDETLIHSLSRHNSSVFSKSKGKMIEIKINNQLATLYYIYKRPFVDEFLNIVKNWFDLICFTASIKEYADPVINFLEEDFINNKGPKAFENNTGNTLFQKRFYRSDCIWESGVGYIKDLSILTGDVSSHTVDETPTKSNSRGRAQNEDSESESSSRSSSVKPANHSVNKDALVDPSKLIIIDNSPISYSMNKENGIMIEGWINDPNDLELMNLLPLLNSLRFTSDVRAILSLKEGEVAFSER